MKVFFGKINKDVNTGQLDKDIIYLQRNQVNMEVVTIKLILEITALLSVVVKLLCGRQRNGKKIDWNLKY